MLLLKAISWNLLKNKYDKWKNNNLFSEIIYKVKKLILFVTFCEIIKIGEFGGKSIKYIENKNMAGEITAMISNIYNNDKRNH